MIVVAALVARYRGWRPAGAFTLGVWGWPVNIAALAYGIAAIVNMSWPRSPNDPWFSNYGVVVTSIGILTLGATYMILGKPYNRGSAPAGDAHSLPVRSDTPVRD